MHDHWQDTVLDHANLRALARTVEHRTLRRTVDALDSDEATVLGTVSGGDEHWVCVRMILHGGNAAPEGHWCTLPVLRSRMHDAITRAAA